MFLSSVFADNRLATFNRTIRSLLWLIIDQVYSHCKLTACLPPIMQQDYINLRLSVAQLATEVR